MLQASRKISYPSCVTAESLKSNPWADGADEKCSWTTLKSSGTDMEVQATGCGLGKDYGMTGEIHGQIHVQDSEHGTGSMTISLTGNGQSIHGVATYTGVWVRASCPAE